MADRVKADLTTIRNCSRSLKSMHQVFKSSGNPANNYKDDLGSDKLRDAFDEFSNTWRKNREKLMKDLENLAKYTEGAADSYDKVDSELAKALRDARKKGKEG